MSEKMRDILKLPLTAENQFKRILHDDGDVCITTGTPLASMEQLNAICLAVNHHDKLVAALENIMAICGNLPDDRYQTRCGPNTSTDRGIKVVAMRRIARETLAQCKQKDGGK